uniref:Uncharacterized protein n=1 Tax=Steinernema glaseri TaxID=37863 RepID=A0A1I7YR88_9BILA
MSTPTMTQSLGEIYCRNPTVEQSYSQPSSRAYLRTPKLDDADKSLVHLSFYRLPIGTVMGELHSHHPLSASMHRINTA